MYKHRELDFSTWPRTKLFEDFKRFDSPGFNVTCKLDTGELCDFAKKNAESLFLVSLHAILRAANQIPEFRQREMGGKAVEFERIGALTPIMPEGGRQYVEIRCAYEKTFPLFKEINAPAIAATKAGKPPPAPSEFDDLICATCNPWFHFESATFADRSFHQSMPLVAWGKIKDGRMPIALRANHTFIDGMHVGDFFNAIQHFFSNPEELFQ